jgi:rhamnosyl/mannosyltransferase
MKILHLGKFYPPFAGGIENFLADLLPAQQALGDEVYALVHTHDKSRSWRVQADVDNPSVYRAPCYGRFLYAPVSPQFPFWLSRLLKTLQPDVLHVHMPNTSVFWALWQAAARHLPWVVHWHADVVASTFDRRLAPAYRLYKPFEQAVLRRAQSIIATSPPYLESSAALADWRDKCHVVPLGMAAARIRQPSAEAVAEAEKLWGDARLRVLNIGRLTYYKGQAALLQAAARLDGGKIIIAGGGELRPRLEKLMKDLAVCDTVWLTGFCDADLLAALLHTCDCFALPSLERTEAFGVVLMEAMAYGKPLLVSEIPGSGVPWVAGDAGLHVPVADIDALVRALIRLRDEPALREALSRQAKAAFAQRFSIAQVAADIQKLYR